MAEMAEKEEKVEVELLDDEGQILPAESEVTKDGKDEVEAYDDKVKADLAVWQSKADENARRAQELETQLNEVVRYAQSQVNENKRLAGLIQSGEKVLVDQAGGRVKAEMAAAESAFRKAYEDGDSEAMLKAQKEIARLATEEAQVRQYRPVQVSEPTGLPVNQQAGQSDEKSKAWIDKNKEWWMKDRPMTGFALGLHEDLIRRGVKPGSDEYIAELDKGMTVAFPSKFGTQETTSQAAAPRLRTQGAAVAPVTRTASGKAQKVQITSSMQAMARRLGVPVQAYAEELAKMEQQ